MKKATFDPRIILAITASFLLLGGIMVFSAYYNHYYAKVSLQIKHASLLMKNVEELLLEPNNWLPIMQPEQKPPRQL